MQTNICVIGCSDQRDNWFWHYRKICWTFFSPENAFVFCHSRHDADLAEKRRHVPEGMYVFTTAISDGWREKNIRIRLFSSDFLFLIEFRFIHLVFKTFPNRRCHKNSKSLTSITDIRSRLEWWVESVWQLLLICCVFVTICV